MYKKALGEIVCYGDIVSDGVIILSFFLINFEQAARQTWLAFEQESFAHGHRRVLGLLEE